MPQSALARALVSAGLVPEAVDEAAVTETVDHAEAPTEQRLPHARERLWDGEAFVTLKVPKIATRGSYPSPDGPMPYWQFPMGVPGGHVKIFVHGLADLRGKTITARVVLMKKTVDEQEYLYVDLFPADGAPATHCLRVMPQGSILSHGAADAWIPTPDPMAGLVIVGSLDLKVEMPAPGTQPPSKRSIGTPNRWDRRAKR